jgi:hypothetical protein
MNPQMKLEDIFNNPMSTGAMPLEQIFGVGSIEGAKPFSNIPQTTKQDGLIKGFTKAVLNPFARMGANIAQAGQGVANLGRVVMGKDIKPLADTVKMPFFGDVKPIGQSGDFGKDLVDSLGIGLELASFIPVGRGVKAGVETAKKGTNVFRGATQVGKEGLVGGTLAGAGFEMQQDDATVGSTLGSGAIGGVLGGALGGVLGAGTTLVGQGVRALKTGQVMQKELNELLSDPTTHISQKLAERTGNQPLSKVVAGDKALSESIRQGVDAPTSFMVRHSTPADKQIMNKMLDVAERVFENPAATQRSSDLVGGSIIKRTNDLNNVLRKTGKQIDEAAQNLKGQSVAIDTATSQFSDELSQAGVRMVDGKLNFANADFEGIKPAERLISDIFKRMQRAGDDAYELHRLKRFIDEKVNYAKQGEGLTGQAERIVKGLRANIDGVLDGFSGAYKTANDTYAQGIQIADVFKKFLGKDFALGDKITQTKAGMLSRRLFSNAQSRPDLLKVLDDAEKFLTGQGIKYQDDIITQAAFVNELEKIFGSQASTGIQNELKKGLQQFATGETVGSTFNKQGIRQAGMKVLDNARGVNMQNQIKALRELLSQ